MSAVAIVSQPTPRDSQPRPGQLPKLDRQGHVWPRASVPPAAGTHLQIARRGLQPVPESCRLAREFTRKTLCDWNMETGLQDAVLVVSELVTNALRHGAGCGASEPGHGTIELIWWRRVSHLVCVVIDPSTQPPVLAPDNLAAESGRGLHVVQAVSSAWGWTALSPREKAVWATLAG